MARRYRYAFVKKKESKKGKSSVVIAAAALLVFFGAVMASYYLKNQYGFIVGGICLFSALLSVYGFVLGLTSFSEEHCTHRTSIVGSIANGIIMVVWLAFYLMGIS